MIPRLVRISIIAVLTAQIVFIVVGLASIVLSPHLWIADIANFLRQHLLIAAVGLFAFGVALPVRTTKVGGAFAFVTAVIPFLTLPAPAPAVAGTSIVVVSANVDVHNPEPADFLAIPSIADADVLVLQEVRPRWQEALASAGRWKFESSRDLVASTDMKLFSRFPILSTRTVSPESTDTGGRFAIRYELLVGELPVIVYAVHPQTPRAPEMWRERSAYLRDLEKAIRSESPNARVIVAGDWNTPPWSPFFKEILSSTGYRTTESQWWPLPTRFSIRFWSLTQIGTPIDRIVLSPAVGLGDLSLGPTFGSNHLPVIARLTIP